MEIVGHHRSIQLLQPTWVEVPYSSFESAYRRLPSNPLNVVSSQPTNTRLPYSIFIVESLSLLISVGVVQRHRYCEK